MVSAEFAVTCWCERWPCRCGWRDGVTLMEFVWSCRGGLLLFMTHEATYIGLWFIPLDIDGRQTAKRGPPPASKLLPLSQASSPTRLPNQSSRTTTQTAVSSCTKTHCLISYSTKTLALDHNGLSLSTRTKEHARKEEEQEHHICHQRATEGGAGDRRRRGLIGCYNLIWYHKEI